MIKETKETKVILSSGGYVLIRVEGHPRATKKGYYVFEHIIVMEKSLGRLLVIGEIVHHSNHNKIDNRLANLELLTRSEHSRLHYPLNQKLGFKKGVPHTKEHNAKVAQAKREWWKAKKEMKNG